MRSDTDGVPWRVKSDSFEDQVTSLDGQIRRLSSQRQLVGKYSLLDGLIRQGIPEDGPSKPMKLYGCTYYAASRRNVDSWTAWGHGGAWAENAANAGWEIGTVPLSGALVSFRPGASYGDDKGVLRSVDGTYGHVAYVEEVDWTSADQARIKLSEGNYIKDMAPGSGNKRENIWITLSNDQIKEVTFIYGPQPQRFQQEL